MNETQLRHFPCLSSIFRRLFDLNNAKTLILKGFLNIMDVNLYLLKKKEEENEPPQ